jgi:hypothetical protein
MGNLIVRPNRDAENRFEFLVTGFRFIGYPLDERGCNARLVLGMSDHR